MLGTAIVITILTTRSSSTEGDEELTNHATIAWKYLSYGQCDRTSWGVLPCQRKYLRLSVAMTKSHGKKHKR